MENNNKQNNTIIGASIILFIGPVLIDLVLGGIDRIFSYFAADTFYYLSIARNYSQLGFFTFDHTYPTNGFHPLWQIFLGLLYQFLNLFHPSESIYLLTVFLVNLFIIAFTIFLLGKCFVLLTGRVPLLFTVFPVGIYAIFVAPITSQYGTLWSFANGMESSFTLLFYALLMWFTLKTKFFSNPTVTSAVLVGFLLGFVFLSRLDHAFLTVSYLGFAGLHYLFSKKYKNIVYIGISAVIVIALLGIYLAWNQSTVGTLMPISGITKSTFPQPHFEKLPNLIDLIRHPDQANATARLWRHAQLDFPVFVSFLGFIYVAITWIKKKVLDEKVFLLEVNIMLVFLLWTYNFFFVNIWAQGHWYFPVSIIFISLLTCYAGDRWTKKIPYPYISIFLLFIIGLFWYGFIYRNDGYNMHYANLFNHAEEIKSFYGNNPPNIIEYDDGIISYATGFKAMSGLGLALDKEAMIAKENQQFIDIAVERGFTYLTSLNYGNSNALDIGMPSEEIHKALEKTMMNEPGLEKYELTVDYKSTDGRIVIISIVGEK